MIASIRGIVERVSVGELVVDVNGVGYLVRVPAIIGELGPELGEETTLRVVTVVREDEISLYGFTTEEAEWLFTLLQNVSGVGPKLALKVLSGLAAPMLRRALAEGDLAMLTSIAGVGKKLAQRLVVELGEKVAQSAVPGDIVLPAQPAHAESTIEKDALAGLESLGYPARVAKKGIEKALSEGAATVEELIRGALKSLAKNR